MKGVKPWKETYSKHVKTFVAIGEVNKDDSWRKPVGMALEIVPVTEPMNLRVGQKAKFQLLSKGKPWVNSPVGLMVEGEKERTFQKTDAEGCVSFPFAKAGKVLLYAVDLRQGKDGATWESNFTTLTVGVKKE